MEKRTDYISWDEYFMSVAMLSAMNPNIMDVLPLSLEEVFTYEMETMGYSFNLD